MRSLLAAGKASLSFELRSRDPCLQQARLRYVAYSLKHLKSLYTFTDKSVKVPEKSGQACWLTLSNNLIPLLQ
jgi:hypothetical protein